MCLKDDGPSRHGDWGCNNFSVDMCVYVCTCVCCFNKWQAGKCLIQTAQGPKSVWLPKGHKHVQSFRSRDHTDPPIDPSIHAVLLRFRLSRPDFPFVRFIDSFVPGMSESTFFTCFIKGILLCVWKNFTCKLIPNVTIISHWNLGGILFRFWVRGWVRSWRERCIGTDWVVLNKSSLKNVRVLLRFKKVKHK